MPKMPSFRRRRRLARPAAFRFFLPVFMKHSRPSRVTIGKDNV